MKKRIWLSVVMGILLLIWGGFIIGQSRMVQFMIEEDKFYISIKADNREMEIQPWYDDIENVYYFFLPSCVQDEKIYFDFVENENAMIEGSIIRKRDCLRWKKENIYTLGMNGAVYQITFMKSDNIPAFFMETDSGSMDYIHEYLGNQEMGELTVVNKDGNVQYAGRLDKISGRGNSTWRTYKKPYSITLHESGALCGLESGRKWNLLSLYYEHDKIHSKIIYDMAREIGLAYTPECAWIDLYCNGEYKGIYLLTEAITVADGRVEIYDLDKENEKENSGMNLDEAQLVQENGRRWYQVSSAQNSSGGYLIEKEIEPRLEAAQAYFTTKEEYLFVVKSPKHASKEQVNYIADFIQSIEDMICQGDSEYKKYIDTDSFAKKYLIDLIAMDADRMNMSMFFYKEKDKNIIYSGPVWDFDQAIGAIHPEYNTSIDMDPYGMDAWYLELYRDEEFYHKMLQYYQEILPYMERVLNEDVDVYADYVSASVEMDSVLVERYREPDATMSYKQYDSYIRYLKYFLANRLNYLNMIWEITDIDYEVPVSTGDYHQVILRDEDENILETRLVVDGQCIENLPVLDTEKYAGWYYDWGYSYRKVSPMMPVYEDMVIQSVLNP